VCWNQQQSVPESIRRAYNAYFLLIPSPIQKILKLSNKATCTVSWNYEKTKTCHLFSFKFLHLCAEFIYHLTMLLQQPVTKACNNKKSQWVTVQLQPTVVEVLEHYNIERYTVLQELTPLLPLGDLLWYWYIFWICLH